MATTCCMDDTATPFTGNVLPRATGYSTGVTNDWLYMNLTTGETFNTERPNSDIREGEQKGRTDWDIAICGHTIRTNSGTSGNGDAAATDLGYGRYGDWTSVRQLPADAIWDNDTTEKITMSTADWTHHLVVNGLDIETNPWFDPNNGPAQTTTSANPTLSEAIKFAAPPPTYTPSLHTYAIRTADGHKYFKIQIVSWYAPNATIGDTGGQISYYCDMLTDDDTD